jgi:hypothetical protein
MTDLGTKYECTGCGTKFYDMGRADAICPKCGLNPLTEEVEEIVEDEPAEEPAAAEEEAPSDDDDEDDVELDEDEDGDEIEAEDE